MARRGGHNGGANMMNDGGYNMMPTHNPVALAANFVSTHENNYRQSVSKIQASALFLAEKISKGQQIENCLACSSVAPAKENDAFLEEQRTLLKDIATSNVLRDRDIAWFVRAIKQMSSEAAAAAANKDEEEEEDERVPDFCSILLDKMEAFRNERSAVEVDIYDEKYCKEIRSRLGEKEHKKRKKGRRSAVGYESDDDDLEIINDQTQANEEKHVKCPITSTLFEQPLKSKVCSHTYSTAGIKHLLTKKLSVQCPVAGCTNGRLTMEQLEQDIEMEMRVKRFMRTKEREEDKRRRINDEDDEDEAEFEEEQGLQTTVIS